MAKKVVPVVRCYDCSRAYLMRSTEHNPIVAECMLTRERHVSTTVHPCEAYDRQMKERVINPMIKTK